MGKSEQKQLGSQALKPKSGLHTEWIQRSSSLQFSENKPIPEQDRTAKPL